MNIKEVFKAKEKCQNRLKSINVALDISKNRIVYAPYDDRITLTVKQAEDLKELLEGYYSILDEILDKAEVGI